MLFERRPVTETEDTILAHSIKLKKGSLKKGHILTKQDIIAIQEAGYESITIASLEKDDIAEDEAADRLANVLIYDHLETTKAFTGRCNLRAKIAGLLILNQTGIERLNLVHESLTVATLPAFTMVTPKQIIATIKVIPFAVHKNNLEQCLQLARESSPLIRIASFSPKSIGFIQTRLPGTKESVLNKTRVVLEQRLDYSSSRIIEEIRCNHNESEIVPAIDKLTTLGADIILISGASAIVDRGDVIPSAINESGGDIIHMGMPVDPGNLLLLAKRGKQPILGLPGCARSPKMNGLDMVLDRLLADIPVSAEDIMRMGVGGLLKEISTRPQPRANANNKHKRTKNQNGPRVTALILAAGTSSRAGDINKLLIDVDGQAMITHSVNAALASQVNEVIVVTGHEQERIKQALTDYDVRFVHNPDYQQGMSTSLAAGLNAIHTDMDAFVICLADMPKVSADHIDKLIAAFDAIEGREICVPICHGKRGNPVLWSRRFLSEMTQLSGDVGAKQLIREYSEVVTEVSIEDTGVLLDIDTDYPGN